jgi:hypothetical protein
MYNQVMAYNPSDENLVSTVKAIEDVEPLLEQGLLREDELSSLYSQASGLYEAAADHNSVQYRKYDKKRRGATRWREVSRDGYVDKDDAIELFEIKQQIIELLNMRDIDIQPAELEVFLPPNSQYQGRLALRNILSGAESSIDLKDDYLFSTNRTTKNIELLAILSPYLNDSVGLKVRLLGSSDELPSGVRTDVKAFMAEFKNVAIQGYSRGSDGSSETHDRFILVDGHTVYKIGVSIKDLGASQSSIDRVNDPDVTQQYVSQFEDWWSKSSEYAGLS